MSSYGTLNKTQVPCGMARPQLKELFLIIWPLALPVPLQSSCKTLSLHLTIKSSLFPYWPVHLFSRNLWLFPYLLPQVPIILHFILGSYAASLNIYCFIRLLVWQMFSQNPESHGHLAHWAVQGKVFLNKQVYSSSAIYAHNTQF